MKHQNDVLNLFKINYKTSERRQWEYKQLSPIVLMFISDCEQVNVGCMLTFLRFHTI